jgi:hypothetical protein
MPGPLHLSDEEMDVLLGLAAPIDYARRREFMEAVAAAVEQAGVGTGAGSGSAWCTGWRARSKDDLCSRRNAKRRSPPRLAT